MISKAPSQFYQRKAPNSEIGLMEGLEYTISKGYNYTIYFFFRKNSSLGLTKRNPVDMEGYPSIQINLTLISWRQSLMAL